MPVDITPLLRFSRSPAYTRARFWGGIIGLELALATVAYLTLWGR
jgi:hypothetical protein